MQRYHLLRLFLKTAIEFWKLGLLSSGWLLSVGILLITILLLVAAYAMNTWHREMFDSLQERNAGAVVSLSAIYFAILLVSVLLSIAQIYVRMTLQRRWRAWVSNHLLDRWLRNGQVLPTQSGRRR